MPIKRLRFLIAALCLTGFCCLPVSELQAQLGQNAPAQSKKNAAGNDSRPETPTQTADPTMSRFQQLQDQTVYKKGFDKRRFFFGGGVGAQFGTLTAVELSPTVGYTFHRMFKMGISLTFEYFAYNYLTAAQTVERRQYFLYGGSLFARFYPIKYLYLHAEIMGMNQPRVSNEKRYWMAYPLIGFGYNQPLGEHAALQLQLLWNLNNAPESIIANPVVSLGFNIRP